MSMNRRSIVCGKLVRSAAAAWLALASTAAAAQPADQATLEKQLADARARLDASAREVAKLSAELYGDSEEDIVRMMHHRPPGAMLGVNVGGPGERDDGVAVAGVSPGGPAEAAGLRAGDTITAVNGEALRKADGRTPASQLVAYMRKVEPGQTVKLQFTRDGKPMTAEVKAAAAEPMRFTMMHDRMMPMGMPAGAPMRGLHEMMVSEQGFGALELVPLSPGLGRYFGTDKGLLVVRTARDSGLGLSDGDVVQSIGGRTPESPGQAFRILQSYNPGDKVKLGILRDRKHMDVDATLPPAPAMGGHAHPAAPPAAPRRPAPPMPPPDGNDPA
jgi:S1-C subfamily serine protease